MNACVTLLLIFLLSCNSAVAGELKPVGQTYQFARDSTQGFIGDFESNVLRGPLIIQSSRAEMTSSLIRTSKGFIDHNQLKGEARDAYEAASEYSWLLEQIFPYSGNDLVYRHKNVADAFKCDFAIHDPVSRQQALKAVQMYKEGKSISQIQDEEEKLFAQYYPVPETQSTALRLYNAGRKKAKSKVFSPCEPLPNRFPLVVYPDVISRPSAVILAPFSPEQPYKWNSTRYYEQVLRKEEIERDHKFGEAYAHPPGLFEP